MIDKLDSESLLYRKEFEIAIFSATLKYIADMKKEYKIKTLAELTNHLKLKIKELTLEKRQP